MSEAAKNQRATRGEQAPNGVVDDPALLALLDHLGRLLAKEYVDRLKKTTHEPAARRRR